MRNLPSELATELAGSSIRPALLAEMFFDSGTLRMWTGYGSLTVGEDEYMGGGNLVGISPIDETQDTQAKGIIASLSGIPSNLIAAALTERSRGRKFNLYLTSVVTQSYVATEDDPGIVLTEDGGFVLLENAIIDTPYRIFSGLMDVIEFTDNGETSTLRMSVESSLIVGQRAKIMRYTSEDQKKMYPDDEGLDFINALQDKEIVW